MPSILTTLSALALAAITLSCGGSPASPIGPLSSSPPPTSPVSPTAEAGRVDITISSVTLADDCGTGPSTRPEARSIEAERSSSQKIAPPSAGARASMGDRACEQSSVQLRVANGTKAPSTVTIKKVQVLEESGTVLGDLTARAPSYWTGDAYEAWDGKVAPDQVLQVGYALSHPAVRPGGTYIVRVTIASDAGDQTLEQRATLEAEASLPPGAVT